MIEYSDTQEVVDTIFGMHGTIVGNCEVQMLNRIINVPSSISRKKAWGEQLDSGDRQLGTSTRVGT